MKNDFSIDTTWDIETGPLPLEDLQRICDPFKPEDPPGEFDPSTVKIPGNWGAEAVQKKIEAERLKHVEKIASYQGDCEQAEAAYWKKIVDNAAKSAETGFVCAVGIRDVVGGELALIHCGPTEDPLEKEPEILRETWDYLSPEMNPGNKVGHNIYGFDLPFLVRRSIIRGVPVPQGLIKDCRYWHPSYHDTMVAWRMGVHGYFIKLGVLAQLLGVGAKSDDCTGAKFYYKFVGTPKERATALRYLANDLDMTYLVAKKIYGTAD